MPHSHSGSLADIAAARPNVRFTPEHGHRALGLQKPAGATAAVRTKALTDENEAVPATGVRWGMVARTYSLRGGGPEGERIQHPAKAISRQLYVSAERRRGC